jgi:hypothetical protein
MGKTLAVDVPKKYIVECLPPPPPKDYKFTCSSCDKQFVKLSRLKMHQVTHLPVVSCYFTQFYTKILNTFDYYISETIEMFF